MRMRGSYGEGKRRTPARSQVGGKKLAAALELSEGVGHPRAFAPRPGVWYPARVGHAGRAARASMTDTKTQPHWADELADQILERPGPHRISTGISPSG